jgi:tetratricopeptide (TPR) repeat protein
MKWRGACCLIAVLWTWPEHMLFAQAGVQVSAPANTFENPFVNQAPAKPRIVAEEPQVARRVPTTYQNPFANMAKTPPVDSFLRPGPVSRWQRPEIPDNKQSLIKSAISIPLPTKSRPTWDQLPPTEILRRQAVEHAVPTDPTFYNNLIDADEVIKFNPTPLTQPIEVAPVVSDDATFSLGPVRTHPLATATKGKSVDPIAEIAAPKPEQLSKAFDVELVSMPGNNANGGGNESAMQGEEVPSAEIVAACSDTAEGWLAQAKEAASNAASAEELTNVINLCQRGIQQHPSEELLTPLRHLSAWTYNQRGELYTDAERMDEALQDFTAAIKMDPECSQALHNRGVTFAQRNQYAAALRDFNRVIELNPGVGIAYRNRAELLSALDRMEEAVADYSVAIEALPEDAGLLRARAHAYQRIGDFAHATGDIARAIELEPHVPEAYTERGNLQAEQGRFGDAQDSFRKAIEIDPNNADAHRSLAWLHATCPDRSFRNPQRALELADAAAHLSSPEDYLILDTLAAAKASAGRFDEAVALERKALNAAPPAVATALQQRLSIYESGKPYTTPAPKSQVQAASHEAPVSRSTARPSPKSRPMK